MTTPPDPLGLLSPGRLLLVAGPCVVEGRDVTLRIAKRLKEIAAKRPVTLLFKASYDKANRTSGESFRGPGMEEALAILADVRKLGLPVNTDVHESAQVPRAAAVVDTLQVPAFLCRQTDLLLACARTGKPVIVKKGQFAAPEDMRHAVAKIASVKGHGPVLLCERGTTFGYRNLVVDFRSLPIMRQYAPVIFDGTHSVQRPAGEGAVSGGDRAMIPFLVRAAAAVGIDGLFLETHEDPPKALSDAATQLPLDELPALIDEVLRIRAVAQGK
ncbi:MAG: 3-deoxy-8-phosphooctulonate synthase [Planctomycetes bacterium]|nr:3-deoxy-8-phosphooctulonate synthase [Planctomycetota bacterium]